jgi:dTDP-4-amino-4,6-dideoxygalactose transaminase
MKGLARWLKTEYPDLHRALSIGFKRLFGKFTGVYPRPLAGEVGAVKKVLYSSHWNMAYGTELEHHRLEREFARYLGVPYAIAVNTGGMALQMSFRALGLVPGDEVLLQVDTCSASALSVLNAGCTPIFADISERTFMLSEPSIEREIRPETKAILATHMWGNPEDIPMIERQCRDRGIALIEDACLSLGAKSRGRLAGTTGVVGVFSFGCIKPIQGGEGGMIVTHDEALARELRSLRHWGDRTIEYGVRDTRQLAWNGRMSEIVAAVVRQQLKGYPSYLESIRERTSEFSEFLESQSGFEIVLGDAVSVEEASMNQIVLKIDPRLRKKDEWMTEMRAAGLQVWHANFERIPSLGFFREDLWRKWIPSASGDRVSANYRQDYPIARETFESKGIGINRLHFGSDLRFREFMKTFRRLITQV